MNPLKLILAVAALASAHAFAAEPLLPLSSPPGLDAAKVALGRTLFHDKRMSRDGKVSCASCHAFPDGGSDPRPVSVGAGGAAGQRNSMSIFNLAFQSVVNWDGRSASVAQLVDRLVTARPIMDGSWEALLRATGDDPALARRFREAYRDGVTKENYIDAAVTYVRSLVTPSRFDRFLRGDATALSREEQEGYREFKAAGCVSCHAGAAVGGNALVRFGVAEDYFEEKRRRGLPVTDSDKGRFNITKDPADMHVFKVPSLRNVALTAPYFHDASAGTLDQAVEAMFRFQLGRRTAQAERRNIVRFLESLTGESLPSHPRADAHAAPDTRKDAHASR
jgi:cytochrome c peroxidase